MTTDDTPLYENERAPVEQRVDDLVSRMTLQEKVGQMSGMILSRVQSQRWERTSIGDIQEAIEDHNIGSATPFASAFSPHNSPAVVPRLANRLQRVARNNTRLGIPLFISVDAVHGHANIKGATVFPQNLGIASSWNPELARRIAVATRAEMIATGANVNFSPNAGVVRDMRWGRTYETYGESSHLVSEMVAAEIEGLSERQEQDLLSVAPSAKHFPTDGAPSQGEDGAPIEVSTQTLNRVHLPPFERALDCGTPIVMLSPNAINGEPVHGSNWYVDSLLRDRLGFDGIVASWHGGFDLYRQHRTATSKADAVAQAIHAGLDIAFVEGTQYTKLIEDLVESGEISIERIDESVRRLLTVKFELGLFDDPYLEPTRGQSDIGTAAHRRLALEAARESLVVLQNDGDVLPLPDDAETVLVTGPNADSLNNLCGGRTIGDIDRSRGTTVLEAVRRTVDEDSDVRYHPGTTIRERIDIDAVEAAAGDADVAIVAVGENWYVHEFGPEQMTGPLGEFPSRKQLSLPQAQRDLCERVAQTGVPTILVSVAGRPLALTEERSFADAMIFGFYPGFEGGQAIADVLFGTASPTGALPVTIPKTIADATATHDRYPHPRPLGDNEHPPSYDPLFEFGHGLTYADIKYEWIDVTPSSVGAEESVTVSVRLRNHGQTDGTEIVQLYLRDCLSSCLTPIRELKRFARVAVPAGETRTVRLTLEWNDLAVVRPDGSRTVEPGRFEVEVGGLEAGFTVDTTS